MCFAPLKTKATTTKWFQNSILDFLINYFSEMKFIKFKGNLHLPKEICKRSIEEVLARDLQSCHTPFQVNKKLCKDDENEKDGSYTHHFINNKHNLSITLIFFYYKLPMRLPSNRALSCRIGIPTYCANYDLCQVVLWVASYRVWPSKNKTQTWLMPTCHVVHGSCHAMCRPNNSKNKN